MGEQVINSQASLDAYCVYLQAQFEKHKYLRMDLKTGKQRTSLQNNSLHLYCDNLAETLNDAGYDMRATLKPGIEIPWNRNLVKEYLWKPIQKHSTGHESTTKPKTNEYGQVYDILSRHLGEKLGVFVEWPSKDNI